MENIKNKPLVLPMKVKTITPSKNEANKFYVFSMDKVFNDNGLDFDEPWYFIFETSQERNDFQTYVKSELKIYDDRDNWYGGCNVVFSKDVQKKVRKNDFDGWN